MIIKSRCQLIMLDSLEYYCECGDCLMVIEEEDGVITLQPCSNCLQISRDQGYDDGSADGYSSGYEEGFGEGKSEGLAEGREQGFEDGFDEGEAKGYQDGYDQRKREEEEDAS